MQLRSSLHSVHHSFTFAFSAFVNFTADSGLHAWEGGTRNWCIPIPFYYKDMKTILDSRFFKHGETTTHGGLVGPFDLIAAQFEEIMHGWFWFSFDLILSWSQRWADHICAHGNCPRRDIWESEWGRAGQEGMRDIGRWRWRLGRWTV